MDHFIEQLGNHKKYGKSYIIDLASRKHSWLEFPQILHFATCIAPIIKELCTEKQVETKHSYQR